MRAEGYVKHRMSQELVENLLFLLHYFLILRIGVGGQLVGYKKLSQLGTSDEIN